MEIRGETRARQGESKGRRGETRGETSLFIVGLASNASLLLQVLEVLNEPNILPLVPIRAPCVPTHQPSDLVWEHL